jgi:TRAP-type C4-dicarboxylate transport system permease small subunit
MSRLKWIEHLLGRAEFLCAVAGLIVVVLATAIAVISRNVFSSPVVWTGELAILAQVWLTFMGASAVYKERGHVGMAGLVAALPAPLAMVVAAVRDIVLAALLVMVGLYLLRLMSGQWAQTLSTLGLPRALTTLPVVWCMFSITASAVLAVIGAGRDFAAEARK